MYHDCNSFCDRRYLESDVQLDIFQTENKDACVLINNFFDVVKIKLFDVQRQNRRLMLLQKYAIFRKKRAKNAC